MSFASRTMFAAVVGFVVVAMAHADTVVLLDGRAITGDIGGIADGKVACAGQSLDLQQIRRMSFDVKVDDIPLRARRTYLADGSVLIARDVQVTDQACIVDWAYGKGASWSIDQTAAVLLVPLSTDAAGRLKPEAAFAEALANLHRTQDRLLVIADEKITAVDGALDALGADQAVFVWRDEPRKIAREKLYGIVLAGGKFHADRTGWCFVHLKDGSTLWGKSPKLTDKQLTITRDSATLTFPAKAIARIDVRSDRMVFLSDLTPARVDDTALFTFNGWQRDASVLGRPLTLAKKVYEKGLGTHAPCRLTYSLDGRYDTFAAVIGIDDETFGRGDCVFKVELDGKTVLEKRMRAGDEPHAVRLPLGDAESLSLVVEIGEDLDLSDHADWADARLVREK